MASVRFNIEKDNSIYLHFTYISGGYSKYHLKWYTGEKINPKKWDPNKKRAKRSYTNYRSLNQYLDYLEDTAEETRQEMKSKGEIYSKDHFKKTFLTKIGRHSEQRLDAFIIKYFNPENYKAVTVMRNRMKQMLAPNPNALINEIDYAHFQEAVNLQLEEGNSNVYIYDLWQYMQRVMTLALELELTSQKNWKKFKIKKGKPKDKIHLTIDEINKIYYHNYSAEHLRNAALNFVFGFYTGQRQNRYSSILKNPEKYIVIAGGKEAFDIPATKTEARSLVPIHPIAKEILAKKPRVVTIQNLNKYIKVCGKEAGIEESFTRIERSGKTSKEVTYHKYKLITSHTARISFATHLRTIGVQDHIIMQMTGHKTKEQFENYCRHTTIEKYNSAKNHEWFNMIN